MKLQKCLLLIPYCALSFIPLDTSTKTCAHILSCANSPFPSSSFCKYIDS
ncbi:hypothetical protein KC19_3G271400 [Ceratodon purpureus]|uniref:Uncharacterized protein n=1 Tax=Ceratodon purpureus TaxID=3225 RepID=A0A8T0HK89_CERPU|nr:hypothetical protein KC19_12G189300 [Ceratodon purpureus]KAG0571230.1 hypothetical protein KC19_6G221300 [Ceratodon purpureus]KAG0571292.1 hypothetical protein KC19_6G226500 [Ceratodon purpureus]KAG0585263.1 hypothetical protein KC19_3G271400 [Ceratodon purpureus]